MKENKILIFEDDWTTIKGSFEMANIYAFENKLNFDVKARSQDIEFCDWRGKYVAVFVDITLAKNSKRDGYNIIDEIRKNNLFDLNRVRVLTGNSRVEEKLKEMKIDTNVLKIIYKPVSFEEIAKSIKLLLPDSL
jgi:DNA-binding response OmpR family regulator